jgi:hypothetical protein
MAVVDVTTRGSRLEDLPPEVFGLVQSYLPFADIVTLKAVGRYFRDADVETCACVFPNKPIMADRTEDAVWLLLGSASVPLDIIAGIVAHIGKNIATITTLTCRQAIISLRILNLLRRQGTVAARLNTLSLAGPILNTHRIDAKSLPALCNLDITTLELKRPFFEWLWPMRTSLTSLALVADTVELPVDGKTFPEVSTLNLSVKDFTGNLFVVFPQVRNLDAAFFSNTPDFPPQSRPRHHLDALSLRNSAPEPLCRALAGRVGRLRSLVLSMQESQIDPELPTEHFSDMLGEISTLDKLHIRSTTFLLFKDLMCTLVDANKNLSELRLHMPKNWVDGFDRFVLDGVRFPQRLQTLILDRSGGDPTVVMIDQLAPLSALRTLELRSIEIHANRGTDEDEDEEDKEDKEDKDKGEDSGAPLCALPRLQRLAAHDVVFPRGIVHTPALEHLSLTRCTYGPVVGTMLRYLEVVGSALHPRIPPEQPFLAHLRVEISDTALSAVMGCRHPNHAHHPVCPLEAKRPHALTSMTMFDKTTIYCMQHFYGRDTAQRPLRHISTAPGVPLRLFRVGEGPVTLSFGPCPPDDLDALLLESFADVNFESLTFELDRPVRAHTALFILRTLGPKPLHSIKLKVFCANLRELWVQFRIIWEFQPRNINVEFINDTYLRMAYDDIISDVSDATSEISKFIGR